MKSLVHLDMTKLTNRLVAQFCNDYSIPNKEKNYLLNDKKAGFSDYWFEITNKSVKLVAYRSLNGRYIVFNSLSMESSYKNSLNSFSAYVPHKKESVFESLDLDSILDKISFSGIDSLTKKEIEFLKSQSE